MAPIDDPDPKKTSRSQARLTMRSTDRRTMMISGLAASLCVAARSLAAEPAVDLMAVLAEIGRNPVLSSAITKRLFDEAIDDDDLNRCPFIGRRDVSSFCPQRFSRQVARDYEAGRVLWIDSWLFPKSEIVLAAILRQDLPLC